MQLPRKIIIAGGGTGGHIFPAIAIANAIRQLHPETEILFVGARGKMEMEKVPQAGYTIEGLEIAGFQRDAIWKNLSLPVKLVRSLRQAGGILDRFKPQAVVGVGGYASFPVLFLAQRKGIPTLIQEQNSYAGKANKRLARKARKICVAYERMEKFFPAEKIIYTGNPVRKNISSSTVTHEEALQKWGLDKSRKTVLAVGGSLGARSINEALEKDLATFVEKGVQLIWQTGQLFYERAAAATKGNEAFIRTEAFIQNMEYAYAAADIVISRAGAMAVSELCVVQKPVVFVPYPYAAEDHQTQNALSLVHKNAALMIKDADAKNELVSRALQLLDDEKMQKTFIENIAPLGILDADSRIAREILELLPT